MTYDPEMDEPVYSVREMRDALRETAKESFRQGFVDGVEHTLSGAAGLPLSIEGRWKPDTVYEPGALVYHQTEQWLAKASTASEPSAQNALWRRVNLPGISDTPSRGTESI